MKNKRIKFLRGQQTEFLSQVIFKSKFSTKQLAHLAGVHSRSFSDWKKENSTMSLSAAELFCKQFKVVFPEDKSVMETRWKNTQKEANKKGGYGRFYKYGSPGTQEGRSKGGKISLEKLRAEGRASKIKQYTFLKEPNKDLAELIGIMLGDGGIHLGQCTITLNAEKDKKYAEYISSLGEKLFGEKPKFFKRKNECTLVVYYYGSALVEYLLSLGLRSGNKVRQQVGVPEWILESIEYKKACLRGLMDTDGGIFLHRYYVKGKRYQYKKLSFTNRSVPLLRFVNQTLQELGFTPKVIEQVANKKVWLYNMQEVNRYLDIVGTSNSRLLALYGG